MLNNVTHKDLRVITRYGAEFGDEVGTVLTFPTEYADVQREYPIFFRKDPASGEYHSVALLGFGKNENLFLEEGRWLADYVPGIVVRGPFLIGFQERDVGGELRQEPMIHVDLDHPRISHTEGEPVFLPQGRQQPVPGPHRAGLARHPCGPGDEQGHVRRFLGAGPHRARVARREAERRGGLQRRRSAHGRSAQAGGDSTGQSLERLNRAGFLQGAFLVIASMGNVKKLMAMKQRKRAAQASPTAR